MQFGVVLHVTASYANWNNRVSIAREAEKLGYDSVWVSDHFISPAGHPYGLEAWTVLSALASTTNKIRLGTYVLCNQFRHPALLAKMASTLDNISRGRLELGIGAGWFKDEHLAFGFGWDQHLARVERLEETITIVQKLWTEDQVSFDGKYCRLRKATLEPKPLQKPYPPLWIGGASQAVREVVAEVGDGWLPVLPTPEHLVNGVAEIKEKMKRLGRNPEALKVAYGGSGCALVYEKEEIGRKLAKTLLHSLKEPSERQACLIGTPAQIVEKIESYRKAGAQKIVAGFYDFPSLKSMKLFSESVIPYFR